MARATEDRHRAHRTCDARGPFLHRHRDAFGHGPDGIVFFGVHGRQLATGVYQKAWDKARKGALTPEQRATPLAGRPYDLRHACVSTWLGQGVSPAQVAQWAGHGVDVLLKVYAACVDGYRTTPSVGRPRGRGSEPCRVTGGRRGRVRPPPFVRRLVLERGVERLDCGGVHAGAHRVHRLMAVFRVPARLVW